MSNSGGGSWPLQKWSDPPKLTQGRITKTPPIHNQVTAWSTGRSERLASRLNILRLGLVALEAGLWGSDQRSLRKLQRRPFVFPERIQKTNGLQDPIPEVALKGAALTCVSGPRACFPHTPGVHTEFMLSSCERNGHLSPHPHPHKTPAPRPARQRRLIHMHLAGPAVFL